MLTMTKHEHRYDRERGVFTFDAPNGPVKIAGEDVLLAAEIVGSAQDTGTSAAVTVKIDALSLERLDMLIKHIGVVDDKPLTRSRAISMLAKLQMDHILNEIYRVLPLASDGDER